VNVTAGSNGNFAFEVTGLDDGSTAAIVFKQAGKADVTVQVARPATAPPPAPRTSPAGPTPA
jgi:hypothetical protein